MFPELSSRPQANNIPQSERESLPRPTSRLRNQDPLPSTTNQSIRKILNIKQIVSPKAKGPLTPLEGLINTRTSTNSNRNTKPVVHLNFTKTGRVSENTKISQNSTSTTHRTQRSPLSQRVVSPKNNLILSSNSKTFKSIYMNAVSPSNYSYSYTYQHHLIENLPSEIPNSKASGLTNTAKRNF